MKNLTIKDVAFFSNKRINLKDIELKDYVTTDNMKPNRGGIEKAVKLPKLNILPCFEKNDILISNIRPYFKKIWFSDHIGGCSSDVLVFKTKNDFHPKFLYYCLSKDDFFAHMMRGAKGSKMPRGDKKQILMFPIPNICFENQKIIAKILTDIDSKIVINNKIISELNSLGKMIYEYWFVQFNFPDKMGSPYKSNCGEMVWNEELKREIPEGWEAGSLNKYIGRITNGLNPRKNFVFGHGKNLYITIKSIKDNNIDYSNCDLISDEALKIINKRSQLQKNDILFSAIATIGRCYHIDDDPTNWNINEAIFAIRVNEKTTSQYLYSLLKSDEIQGKADSKAIGSSQRCLTMDSFKGITCVCPKFEIMEKFSELISSNYKMVSCLQRENIELEELRNYLLPLLMNGQVRLK